RVLAEIAIFTREAKQSVGLKDLFGTWQIANERHGFTKEGAEALLGRNIEQLVETKESREAELRKAYDLAVDATSATNAYFPERKIVQHVARNLQVRGFSADEILAYVKAE